MLNIRVDCEMGEDASETRRPFAIADLWRGHV